ncbi:MAG: GFA family protein [Pseudorhodobacter sp.]|nr:GFA family protein [Pseudorhodobacter sp.]
MTITGSCRCGNATFKIEDDIPAELTRCTCSFCARRGTLYAYFDPSRFQLTSPEADGATYRWHTNAVSHNFCPICGCGTFSGSPAFEPDGTWDGTTRRIGVNARLFDDFDAAVAPATVIDGKHLW